MNYMDQYSTCCMIHSEIHMMYYKKNPVKLDRKYNLNCVTNTL